MKTLLTFLTCLLPLMAFSQGGPIIRNPATTNNFMNQPSDLMVPFWNGVALKWSNAVPSAATVTNFPPYLTTTTLTNLAGTGLSTGATNAAAYIASSAGRGTNTTFLNVTNLGTLTNTGAAYFGGNILAPGTITAGEFQGGTFRSSQFANGDRALVSDVGPNAAITESSVTVNELGYLSGVSSSLQPQINNRIANLNGRGTNTDFYGTIEIMTGLLVGDPLGSGIIFSNNVQALSDLNVTAILTADGITANNGLTVSAGFSELDGGILLGSKRIKFVVGSDSPESVVTAPPQSIYLQTNELAGIGFWLKTNGLGNTGWWLLAPGGGSGSGEANTASSLGNGFHFFSDKSGVDLRFNTLSNLNSTIQIFSNANVIHLAATNISTAQLSDDGITVAKFADGDWGDGSISGNVFSIDANAIALGTDTTGNYVSDVAGTANEISVSHTPAEGSTATVSLPATIDLGGKTSFELPNAAAPTTDAFGEIAGDNNAHAASRGAVQFFDGTANTWLVGALSSDTPSNGQVPKWNTGGTITWEDDTGSATTNNPVQAVGTLILTNGTIYKPLDLGNNTNGVVSWNTNYYVWSPSNTFTLSWTDVPTVTDARRIYIKIINTNSTAGYFPTNGLNGAPIILLAAPSTNEFSLNYDTNGFWVGSGQILTTGLGDTNVFNSQPTIHNLYSKGTNLVDGNIGFIEQYPTGTGGANTNFTLLVNNAASFVINGFTNVSFRALYGGTLGITYTFSIEITNGSGANRTLEFSPVTNQWNWSYAQAAPTVLTNSERIVVEGKLRGTNITATYGYFPWP